MKFKNYRYTGGKSFSLKNYNPEDTGGFHSKEVAAEHLAGNIKRMSALQDRLYAENKQALLVIFQAMDAAGKDSAIKHVFSGINPQGISVHSFKQPSSEELEHDYLWRASRVLPQRGDIGIFNRSYYEDVLVVKLHNLSNNILPERCKTDDLFERRYRQIVDYEKYLHENGFRIVKFFLNISKDKQKERFLTRINDPNKNWKFSQSDLEERVYWDDYQKVYTEAIAATSTSYAPWYIIPANKKWYTRLLISEIIVQTLEDMNPQYPELSKDKLQHLDICREKLLQEDAEAIAIEEETVDAQPPVTEQAQEAPKAEDTTEPVNVASEAPAAETLTEATPEAAPKTKAKAKAKAKEAAQED